MADLTYEASYPRSQKSEIPTRRAAGQGLAGLICSRFYSGLGFLGRPPFLPLALAAAALASLLTLPPTLPPSLPRACAALFIAERGEGGSGTLPQGFDKLAGFVALLKNDVVNGWRRENERVSVGFGLGFLGRQAERAGWAIVHNAVSRLGVNVKEVGIFGFHNDANIPYRFGFVKEKNRVE